eukprot:scaffold8828_cov204-Amphora_coffeaeformis.AAC.29
MDYSDGQRGARLHPSGFVRRLGYISRNSQGPTIVLRLSGKRARQTVIERACENSTEQQPRSDVRFQIESWNETFVQENKDTGALQKALLSKSIKV